MYIEELSVFARYNAQFLKRAATTVEGFCPELAHELRRNHLEEGGERGKVPAHYVLYSNALLSDLGLLVNGHVPAPETHLLITLHQAMIDSHMPSSIAGSYYATRGAGPRPAAARIRRMVPSPIRWPRPSGSPRMRRCPHRGFSRANRTTRSRSSSGMGGRPTVFG